MSLEKDETVTASGGRLVTLAGQTFTVLPLVLRQVIALAEFLPRLKDINADGTLDADKIGIFVDVLRIGLLRAHPKITRDDLLDLEATLPELVEAGNVVIEQANPNKKDAGSGEPTAASL